MSQAKEQAGRKNVPLGCVALLRKFEKQKSEKQKAPSLSELFVGKILPFELGVRDVGKDVYNPSAPFQMEGKTYLCGRVELPTTCSGSQVHLFEEGADSVWRPVQDFPILPLEDGFVVPIGKNETIIGGVKAYANPTAEHPDKIDYHTVFYRGCRSISLAEFARGPDRMKDIRLMLLANGRIATFTRPQGIQPDGRDCGKGEIAYTELESIDQLNPENLSRARIIEKQFAPEEWGGANELYPLPDGRIGVLGHIAYMDEDRGRHYYAMVFTYDPGKNQATPIEIIARREDFPAGEAKAPDLRDVVFPGGMVRHGDGTATLYAGLGDKQAGCKKLIDPFTEE